MQMLQALSSEDPRVVQAAWPHISCDNFIHWLQTTTSSSRNDDDEQYHTADDEL